MSTALSRAEAAELTAQRLIQTARSVFAEQGFAAVSLDMLAAEAGVTRGALHHHFTNKTGLFEAVLRAVDAELSEELTALYDTIPDPWEAFRACYHRYLDAALRPDRRRILFQDAAAVLGQKATDILMESGFAMIVQDLSDLMEAGRLRRIDPAAVAVTLNGAVLAQAMWLAAEGTPDPHRQRAAHDALDAVFDGLTRA